MLFLSSEILLQIFIEATVGVTSSSDVAIDLLTYDHGICPSANYYCDFEEGTYCENMDVSLYDNAWESFNWKVKWLLVIHTVLTLSKTFSLVASWIFLLSRSQQ